MKIVVISDTHGNYPLAFAAIKDAGSFDMLIHLGDGQSDFELLKSASTPECIHIAGNCDIGSYSPKELVLECGGKKLFLTHGNLYGVKSGYDQIYQRGLELEADVILFGHTHIPIAEEKNGIFLVNPGTLTKTANYHSYVIFEITSEGVKIEHRTI